MKYALSLKVCNVHCYQSSDGFKKYLTCFYFSFSIQFHIFCNVFYFPTELDLLGHMIETKRLKNKNIKWSNSNSSSREDKHSSEKLADKLKMSSKKNTYSHKQQKIRELIILTLYFKHVFPSILNCDNDCLFAMRVLKFGKKLRDHLVQPSYL